MFKSFVISSLLLIAVPAAAQTAPVIDNERVTVWDVKLPWGITGPTTPHDLDAVIMFLDDGIVSTTHANGKVTEAMRKAGDAIFVPAGSDLKDTVTTNGGIHEVVVALKNHPVPPLKNTTGLPRAFPRAGSKKIFENKRVAVWNNTWTPGVPTPMHFHDTDVVVAMLYDGTNKSVTTDNTVTTTTSKAGDIRFNKRDRAHSEELMTERQTGIMVELK